VAPSPTEAPDLASAVAELNALRRDSEPATRAAAGRIAEALFAASHHLIAYGSLVPGGSNAAQLEGLRGMWCSGWVSGALLDTGWGAALGYPALRWSADAETQVRAQLFTLSDLPSHWERLDAFEGAEYQRILAPFHGDDGRVVVGYLYEIAADLPPSRPGRPT